APAAGCVAGSHGGDAAVDVSCAADGPHAYARRRLTTRARANLHAGPQARCTPLDAFVLRVALSVVLGGLAVALFTTAAERLGSRVGGLLLSFPVKVTIAIFLIGLNEGAPFAARAAVEVPAGI